MTSETARRLLRATGAVGALALIAALLAIARPEGVLRLLRTTRLRAAFAALAVYAGMLLLRAFRLQVLLGPRRPGVGTAWLITAAGRAAALFLPFRSGELVLPWLLRRQASVPLATGLAVLLAARAFDLAALGVWGVVSLLWLAHGSSGALLAAVLLTTPLLALPAAAEATYRLARRCAAARGLTARRIARRLRRLRDALHALARRPGDVAASALLSVAVWGAVWWLTWLLLDGMGFHWDAAVTVAGSAAASIANLVPVNLVANVGTLEAGWTAGFVALGKPAAEAAATGFATHLWALLFAVACGGLAWLVLAFSWRGGAPGSS